MLINPHCTNGAGYEWDVGHFEGSARPEVECFKSTEFGLSDTMVMGNLLALFKYTACQVVSDKVIG